MKKNNQKISIISPSLNGGGAEKVAVNLANYYSSIGHEVDLVLFKKKGVYLNLVHSDVNIIDLNTSRSRYVVFKLRKYLKDNTNSCILSVIRDVNILIGISAYGLKIECITYREASTLSGMKKLPLFQKLIYKYFMKISYLKAKNVIANSYDTKIDLINENIIKEDKIKVIGNPVLPLDYKELLDKKCTNKWLLNKNYKTVVSVGRLHKLKNFTFLIECFAEVVKKINNARLVIIGAGNEKAKLQKKIEELNLNSFVQIEEFQENIFPFYHEATLFALSSQWEGFGNVLVEALSAGTPVVSTNCPGGPKMILKDGKYGKLVELNNKKAYIETLIFELEKENIFEKKEELIEYAKKFSVQAIGDEYLDYIIN